MKQKIFLLHGWTYSTEKWAPFVDLLKQKESEPVMLEIPGLTAPLDEVWTVDNYVEWLKKIVDNEKEKVLLLGHSNGGRISMAFALKYPEKVSKLILIDSAGIYHNELSLRLKRFVFGTLAKAGKKIKNIQAIRSIFYRFVREHDYEKANPKLRETMKNLITSDLSASLEKITVPTLIIWGEQDKITPLTDGKLMHELIKNSLFHVVKDARHSPQLTHPKEVVKHIYDSF